MNKEMFCATSGKITVLPLENELKTGEEYAFVGPCVDCPYPQWNKLVQDKTSASLNQTLRLRARIGDLSHYPRAQKNSGESEGKFVVMCSSY